jgi:hypothetical protein
MIYMLKVNMLVAAVVFGFAGISILALYAWTEAKEYARALRVMHRINIAARREQFAISRVSSRNHKGESFRAA